MNDIQTWRQGKFVDQRQYRDMTNEWKRDQKKRESYLVRPGPTANSICCAFTPENAAWIAQRLNLASKLEQMTYDFATGKSDGSEIVDLVKQNVT